MSLATVFDAAYVASKDPRVQALFAGTMGLPSAPGSAPTGPQALDPTVRANNAYNLALLGLLIDAPIDAFGGDPYTLMLERTQYGYTWVPLALVAPITLAPGLSFPGVPTYDPSPPFPPGSIKVSLDLKDYPPFPVVVKPPALVPFVGSYMGNGFYGASEQAQTTFTQGEQYEQNNVNYYFVIGSMGALGATYFWRIVGT